MEFSILHSVISVPIKCPNYGKSLKVLQAMQIIGIKDGIKGKMVIVQYGGTWFSGQIWRERNIAISHSKGKVEFQFVAT